MQVEPQLNSITLGCHVELNLLDRAGNKDRVSIEIVSDESADFSHGFLGASTPLGKVLVGEKAGIIIPYLKDDIFAIEILSVSPSTIKPPENAQEARENRMKKTINEVEHTSAVVFASSFSGKWGDYDPDSLPDQEEAEDDDLAG